MHIYMYTCLNKQQQCVVLGGGKQQQRVVLGGGKHNPTSFASPESGEVIVTGDLGEKADRLRRVSHEVETLHVPRAVFFWACVTHTHTHTHTQSFTVYTYSSLSHSLPPSPLSLLSLSPHILI